MTKDIRGFLKPKKEYHNPILDGYKEKLEWLDKFLTMATPEITVKKAINIIGTKYGNTTRTARATLFQIVDDDRFHSHEGFIHKGGKTKCKWKPLKLNDDGKS